MKLMDFDTVDPQKQDYPSRFFNSRLEDNYDDSDFSFYFIVALTIGLLIYLINVL